MNKKRISNQSSIEGSELEYRTNIMRVMVRSNWDEKIVDQIFNHDTPEIEFAEKLIQQHGNTKAMEICRRFQCDDPEKDIRQLDWIIVDGTVMRCLMIFEGGHELWGLRRDGHWSHHYMCDVQRHEQSASQLSQLKNPMPIETTCKSVADVLRTFGFRGLRFESVENTTHRKDDFGSVEHYRRAVLCSSELIIVPIIDHHSGFDEDRYERDLREWFTDIFPDDVVIEYHEQWEWTFHRKAK